MARTVVNNAGILLDGDSALLSYKDAPNRDMGEVEPVFSTAYHETRNPIARFCLARARCGSNARATAKRPKIVFHNILI